MDPWAMDPDGGESTSDHNDDVDMQACNWLVVVIDAYSFYLNCMCARVPECHVELEYRTRYTASFPTTSSLINTRRFDAALLNWNM